VAIVYFDASAVVKLLVQEEGSEIAEALWDGCDAALSSRLTHPEVCSALAAAGRNHDLKPNAVDDAFAAWTSFWSAIRPIELSPSVEQRAGEFARRAALRGADAIHLASALVIPPNELVMAVWDRRLHAAAAAEGIAVAPSVLAD
jgi:predicted nucleic acid-binding protein